jgi:uncharacterized protein (DUF4213/DUF364 family)
MPTDLMESILVTLPGGKTRAVRIGAFWTAVVAEVDGRVRCGLAATLRGDDQYHHDGGPSVVDAGRLDGIDTLALAHLIRSPRPLETTIGTAALNALLPRREDLWVDVDAADVIAQHGRSKNVVLVGHFPFVPRLREQVGRLWVLEQKPVDDDLPAEAAPDVVPQADVLAMTGTTLMNHTFAELMALRRTGALVLVLGPSTPLATQLFDAGVHFVSGVAVEEIDAVLHSVGQGANFRQLRRHGVRLVTMQAPSRGPV